MELRDIILAENEFIWNYNPGQPRDKEGRWTKGLGFGSNPGGGRDYKPGTVKYLTAEPGYFENTFNSAAITNAKLDATEPVVKRLRRAIRNGEQIDSIVTYPDLSGKKNIADGHHRLSAFMLENKKPSLLLNFPDRKTAWDYVNSHPTGYLTAHNSVEEIDFIWNGWDESKHPRDKKGRFTYVIKTTDLFNKSSIGGTILNPNTIAGLRTRLNNYAKKSKANQESLLNELEDNEYYQNSGYKWINNELRSGSSLSNTMCENLDNSCRFSADKNFKVYRGESSFTNNWSGVKVGSDIPPGLAKAFISTSTDHNTAEKFATQNRPGTGSKVYETTITINVPPTQRFGIPNVYNGKAVASGENEILLPYGTKGTIKSFKETTRKQGLDTIVEQIVEIDL